MKKEYIQPNVRVYKIEMEPILVESLGISDTPANEDAYCRPVGSAIPEFSIWDEEE